MMLRLKQKAEQESYSTELCAAARCVEPAAIIDRTDRLSLGPVPLCDRHWQVRCALDEADLNPSGQTRAPSVALPAAATAAAPASLRPETETVRVGASAGQLRLPFARR